MRNNSLSADPALNNMSPSTDDRTAICISLRHSLDTPPRRLQKSRGSPEGQDTLVSNYCGATDAACPWE